jgi:3-oxoacyl-[acyl-carrier-protein] synthase III
MGARIEAVSTLTSSARSGMRKPTARRLADTAARACLAHAGKLPAEVDILINAGIYREDNMGEPALAALIQEDIGANRGQPPVGGHGTFSFDLINGTCGVINAIQLQAGLLRSRVIRHGMIVTSDVDPNLKDPGAAPFRPAGGAMLLGWDDSVAGFTDFHSETFPEYEDLFVSGLVWQQRRGPRVSRQAHGQSQMVIEERPGYRARSVDCAEEATHRFLRHLGMGIDEIDLLVPAPATPDFLDRLRVRLGVPGDRVAYMPESLAEAYTTGPIAATEAAVKSGRLAEARNVLMLAAGAGITIALALYRNAPAQQGPVS